MKCTSAFHEIKLLHWTWRWGTPNRRKVFVQKCATILAACVKEGEADRKMKLMPLSENTFYSRI
jgi:hypothetical protein